jgi:hypothetical protein
MTLIREIGRTSRPLYRHAPNGRKAALKLRYGRSFDGPRSLSHQFRQKYTEKFDAYAREHEDGTTCVLRKFGLTNTGEGNLQRSWRGAAPSC